MIDCFKKTGLTNNQLKIIAMVAMFCDHLGKILLPQVDFLVVIGRLSFPIFAYMIGEGYSHTRSKKRYFLNIFTMAVICQIPYYLVSDSFYQNILVTFSLSVILMYFVDKYIKKSNFTSILLLVVVIAGVVFLTLFLPTMISGFEIDYGILGVLLPVLIYLAKSKKEKIIITTIILVFMSLLFKNLQFFSLLSIPLLMLYNGKRGERRLKLLFYIFYPCHLLIIYFISLIINI